MVFGQPWVVFDPPIIESFDFSKLLLMPDEVLALIFQHLNARTLITLKLSCKRFYSIVHGGLLGKKVPKFWHEDIVIAGIEDCEEREVLNVFVGDNFMECVLPEVLTKKLFHIRSDSLTLRHFTNQKIFENVLIALTKPASFLHVSSFHMDFVTTSVRVEVLRNFLTNQSSPRLASLSFVSAPRLLPALNLDLLNCLPGNNLETFSISAGFCRLPTEIDDEVLRQFTSRQLPAKIYVRDAPKVTFDGVFALVSHWINLTKNSASRSRNMHLVLGTTNYQIKEQIEKWFRSVEETNFGFIFYKKYSTALTLKYQKLKCEVEII